MPSNSINSDDSIHGHVMLASLGVGLGRNTKYSLDGRSVESTCSAIALMQLLPLDKRPTNLLFAITPEAMQVNWALVLNQAQELGVPCGFIELAGNDHHNDVSSFMQRVSEQLPVGAKITLDVTQGLRHHAFLFYALAMYVSQFRRIEIAGAWYCRFEVSLDYSVARPFIDLKPVLDLAGWFHALAVFRETGSLHEVSNLLSSEKSKSCSLQLSRFFLTGMPLEAGDSAFRLLTSTEKQPLIQDLPLSREIEDGILQDIKTLSGSTFEPQSNQPEQLKRAVTLTEQELNRQAVFIDRYFKVGQLNLAFGLLREWIVNRLLFERGEKNWLEKQIRESVEHQLGGLGAVLKGKTQHPQVREKLTQDQRDWAQRWNTVCDIRNALQHHGMRAEVFQPERSDIKKAKQDWDDRHNWSPSPSFGGGHGRLLICPIGLTPGVLYSAISRVRPSRVLIICSNESAISIAQAIAKAEIPVKELHLNLANVHSGIDEFDSLVKEASAWLFEADEIHANLTGGTTLMGVLVGQLIKRAGREYQRLLREFVLIDKRPRDQQRDDPWQLGEIHYLDGKPLGQSSSEENE